MARYEAQQNQEIDSLRKEVKSLQKKVNKKKSRSLFSCSTFTWLLFAIVIFGIVWLTVYVAETGVVEIPWISERVYTEPDPVYYVEGAGDLASDVKEDLQEQLLLQSSQDPPYSITVSITEAQLTQFVSDKLASIDRIEYIQIAVTDEVIELYARVVDPEIIVSIGLTPAVESEKLKFDVAYVKVGESTMPGFVGRMVIDRFLLNPATQLNAALLNFKDISVKDIMLEPATMQTLVEINSLNNVN